MKQLLKFVFFVFFIPSAGAASIHEMDDEYSKAYVRLSPSYVSRASDDVPNMLALGTSFRLGEKAYWALDTQSFSYGASEQRLVTDSQNNLDYFQFEQSNRALSSQIKMGWRLASDLGYRVTEQYAELALRGFYSSSRSSQYDSQTGYTTSDVWEDEGVDFGLTYGVRTRWGRLGYGASVTQYTRNDFSDEPIIRGELTWRAYSGATLKLIPEFVGMESVERFSLGLQTDFHFDYFF